MDKNSITPSVALEGLNNIESMISRWCIVLEGLNKEDESYKECVEEMKKDAYNCVNGLKDIADYIVNERQMGLALKLESIAKKNVELLQMVRAKVKGEDFADISFILFSINANSRFAKNGIAIQDKHQQKFVSDEWNEDIIKELLEKHEVFEPKDGTYIPYALYYTPASNNNVINNHCTQELFEYCLDRADVSMITTKGHKNVMKAFMKEVALKYKYPDEFKEVAAESFGLSKSSQLGAIGNASSKYDEIFGKVLPRTDQRANLRK